MAVVDSAAPGEAPASSAAAGLLDPLSVKGRLMWQGEAALSAALRLICAADVNAGAGAEASDQCGILHAPHSTKHAEQGLHQRERAPHYANAPRLPGLRKRPNAQVLKQLRNVRLPWPDPRASKVEAVLVVAQTAAKTLRCL